MKFPSAVGAIIKRNGKYLLLDRKYPEYGFASVAGHVDENETPEIALSREVKEESQLTIISFKKHFEEDVPWNICYRHKGHHWIVFECETKGTPTPNDEAKSMGWYSPKEMKKLKLERVWEYFFKKLNILDNDD